MDAVVAIAAIEWWMSRASVVNVFVYPTTEKRPEAKHNLPHPHPNQGCGLAKDCMWNSTKLPADAGNEKWNEEGTFIHFAVTGDRKHLVMYKNGRPGLKKKVDNLPGIGPLVTYGASEDHTKVGGCGIADYDDAGGNYFAGMMDEVAIFDVALTRADIINIRDNGLESTIDLIGKSVDAQGKLATQWGAIKAVY